MKRRLVVAVAILLEAACGVSGGPSTAVSAPRTAAPLPPSAAPSEHGPFAVVWGQPYLYIVGTDGQSHGKAEAHFRSGDFNFQPWVSTSNTAAYYLDGDSALMRFRPGGTPEHLRDLPGTYNVHAVFSISPDDKRVAVALLTYGASSAGAATANYQGMNLYVEDLDGSHNVEIFSSPTVAEWPVGWHGSDLIIAVGAPQNPDRTQDRWPYYAFTGIHVADSTTGTRKANICSGTGVLGLATPDGVLCAGANATVKSDWAGHLTPTSLNCSSAQLQPGGAAIACGRYGETPFLLSAGTQHPLPGWPVCWVGSDVLLLSKKGTGLMLYRVDTPTTETTIFAAFAMGVIPGGL